MDERTSRLIQFFMSIGEWEKRGLNSRIARKTDFSSAYVGQVFNGLKAPADKYLRAVCTAYSISKEWIDTGFKPFLHRRGIYFPPDAPAHPNIENEATSQSDFINEIGEINGGVNLADITDPIIAETISEMLKMPRSMRYRVLAAAVEINENSVVGGVPVIY